MFPMSEKLSFPLLWYKPFKPRWESQTSMGLLLQLVFSVSKAHKLGETVIYVNN